MLWNNIWNIMWHKAVQNKQLYKSFEMFIIVTWG